MYVLLSDRQSLVYHFILLLLLIVVVVGPFSNYMKSSHIGEYHKAF